MNQQISESEERVDRKFAWFHATSVNGTAVLISAVIASYFSPYLVDSLKIPAASASMVMLIATLFDAISNPFLGILADRTNTRWGRYRPYFLIAPVLLTVFSSLIWLDFGWPEMQKTLFVLVAYICYCLTVTLYTTPQMAILPACVKSPLERNRVIMLGAGVTATMFTIGNTFTPQITGFFQSLGFSNGYIPYMLICSALSYISFWGLFAVSRERYLQPISSGNPLSGIGKVLRHKEVVPNLLIWVLASMGYGMMFSTSVYYIQYYYARPDLISVYMGVISIGALLSMLVIMRVFMRVFRNAYRALAISQALSVALYLILFFFGKSSFVFLCVLTFLSACTSSMQNALINVFVNDTIDFVEYKDGISANGVISSIRSFAQKCGNTVVTSGILAVLSLSGYIPGAVGAQPESTMLALNLLKFGIPSIIGLMIILLVRFNPIRSFVEKRT